MIKIAICDDDRECLVVTKQMLDNWISGSNIPAEIYSFDNGDALIAKSDKDKLDIVFLDIFMPLLNGIDTARELRSRDKTLKIIFLTSSPEFALESYSVKAADYCLKPVQYEKIKEIMDDCALERKIEPKNIMIKTVCGYQRIYFHDIEYIEAQNKQVVFFLRSGRLLEASEPLYAFEAKLLNEDGFFKCHRSYLVYIPNVDNFSSSEIKTKSGRNIPIARGVGKAFGEAYFSFMFRD